MGDTATVAELVIPPDAIDARDMAERVVRVADALADAGIKPNTLSCEFTYLYGHPDDEDGNTPSTSDGVEVQVEYDEQDALIKRWGLLADDGSDGNRYASGVIFGVAVMVYAGRPKVAS